MNPAIRAGLAVIGLTLFAWEAGAQGSSLEELRHDLAMRYMEPQAHMALAKHHWEQGRRLLAFHILESARRRRFNRPEFDAAFREAFLDEEPLDHRPEAEAALRLAVQNDPRSIEPVSKLIDLYVFRRDWPRAKRYLRKAMQLQPEEFSHVEWMAQVLMAEQREGEAETLIGQWLEAHPDSFAAYERRINARLGGDPDEVEPLVLEALERYPNSGTLHFNLGVVYQQTGDPDRAELEYVKAAKLDSASAHIQAWTGRFFLKVRSQPDKALTYYLNAYFLDPHFYDTEYVESHIRGLSYDRATAGFAKQRQRRSLAELLADADHMLVALAIGELKKHWDRQHVGALIACMGSDDPSVRWEAADLLRHHAEACNDPRVRQLESDPDLRKRGLSVYIAMKRSKEEGIALARKFLDAQAQLLRFDALSALVEEGSEQARHILTDYHLREKNPRLKRLLAPPKSKKTAGAPRGDRPSADG